MSVALKNEVAAAAKSFQSCLTPSDPMDCSPPGPSIHGIFQARVLEWVAIAFSTKMRLVPLKEETREPSLPLCLLSTLCGHSEKKAVCRSEESITRHRICWCLDFGLPNLQNYEK